MTFIRIALIAFAVLLPASWTIARAADEPPAGSDTGGETTKTTKSTKKSSKKKKKGESSGAAGEGGSDTSK